MGKEQTVPTIVENFEVEEEVQKLKKELTKNKKRKLEESMEQREEIKNLTKEKKNIKKLEDSKMQRADFEELLQIIMQQNQRSLNQHAE